MLKNGESENFPVNEVICLQCKLCTVVVTPMHGLQTPSGPFDILQYGKLQAFSFEGDIGNHLGLVCRLSSHVHGQAWPSIIHTADHCQVCISTLDTTYCTIVL